MAGLGNKLKKNALYNIIYQASVYITPLIVVHHTARVLGPENNGLYSFVQSIVSYFILAATLGTTYYGQRTIASVRNDPIQRQKKFREIVLLRMITTAVALIIFYSCVVLNVDNRILWAVAGMEIITVGLDVSWFFQGMEEFGVIALTNVCARLLSVVFIVLLVRERNQLTLYVFLYCAFLILGLIAQWIFLRRFLDQKGYRADLRALKTHLVIAAGLFVAQAAIQVYTVLDKTMIGLITHSDLQNGYYEEAQKLIRVLVAVSTSIGTVMASRVAFLWAEKKNKEINDLLLFSFRIVSCIGLFIFMMLQLCVDQFVPFYYGPEYGGVVLLLRILSLQPVIIGFSSIVGMQFFVPTGKERYLTLSVIIGSILNVIMNIFLINRLQAAGAALASVVAEISVTGIQFFIGKKYLDMKPIPGIAIRYVLIAVPVFAAGYGIKMFMQEGLVSMLCICGVSGVLYGIMLFLTKDPLIKTLIGSREKKCE